MAILTEGKINQFGVLEEYWRITNININLQYNYCDLTLAGYSTKESRDSELEPMSFKKVRAKWSEDEFEKYFSPMAMSKGAKGASSIYNVAYEYVKHKDEYFKDAKDI